MIITFDFIFLRSCLHIFLSSGVFTSLYAIKHCRTFFRCTASECSLLFNSWMHPTPVVGNHGNRVVYPQTECNSFFLCHSLRESRCLVVIYGLFSLNLCGVLRSHCTTVSCIHVSFCHKFSVPFFQLHLKALLNRIWCRLQEFNVACCQIV